MYPNIIACPNRPENPRVALDRREQAYQAYADAHGITLRQAERIAAGSIAMNRSLRYERTEDAEAEQARQEMAEWIAEWHRRQYSFPYKETKRPKDSRPSWDTAAVAIAVVVVLIALVAAWAHGHFGVG